jgi:tetratricopeptide (TPR) repeat protein
MAARAEPEAPASAGHLRAGWISLALFVLAFLPYARTGGFGFVAYDDPAYVRDNPHLERGLDAHAVAWALTSTDYQYNWHPLTWLSHAFDVERFGQDAAGPMHLHNAALHALNAALLHLALLALTRARLASAFAAALFALHPLRVESVAWISERKDLLAGTGFMLALWLYARHARAPTRGRLAAVGLALFLGLMAKPSLVTLPALFFVLDVWPLARLEREPWTRLVGEKLLLALPCVLASFLTLQAQEQGGALNEAVPLAARLAHAPQAYLAYLGNALWPTELAVFYPQPALAEPERARGLATLLASGALLAALALAWRWRARAPWLLVGALWFLGVLVPMIGLVQVGGMARADRYAYLSLIGLELALALSLIALARLRPGIAKALAAAALALLLVLGVRTWSQVGHWRDTRTLFTHALAVTERNWVAHLMLGQELGNSGDNDGALEHFEAARAALPGFFEAELNLGKARYARREFEAAGQALERALASRPRSGEARLCLAFVRQQEGDFGAAERELEQALADEPALALDGRVGTLRARLDEGQQ